MTIYDSHRDPGPVILPDDGEPAAVAEKLLPC